MRPYRAVDDHKSHAIMDNDSLSKQSFPFLVECRPIVLVYRHDVHIVAQHRSLLSST